MFLLTVVVYWWTGNKIVLTTLLTARKGMDLFNHNINRINRLYQNSFTIEEAMERLNKFYNSPENQSGLVAHSKEENESPYSVQVNGCFSYGVAPVKDKAEKDELIGKLILGCK